MCNRLLPLLKYVNRSAITPEAVGEILAACGVDPTAVATAEIATAFKTRGMAGLVPYLPSIMAARDSAHRECSVVTCPNCGRFVQVPKDR